MLGNSVFTNSSAQINVNGNLNLLRQAEAAGAKRFIVISSLITSINLQTGGGFTADSESPACNLNLTLADHPFLT